MLSTKKRAKYFFLIASALLVIIFFEASQQYYYITQFNLEGGTPISFWNILTGHFYRWVICTLLAIPLVLYIQKNPIENVTKKSIVRYFVVFVTILALNIAIISMVQLFLNREAITLSRLTEYLLFYTFQKGPVYFIAYLGLVAAVHYFMSTKVIQVKMQELSSLKATHEKIYLQLKSESLSDTSPVIQVKTGTRLHYVAVQSIRWIEADDYCVKLHDHHQSTYTVRTSLKTLEDQLSAATFIRVHRKAMVNKNFVQELDLKQTPKVILDNKEQIAIAQSRLKNVKRALGQPIVFNT